MNMKCFGKKIFIISLVEQYRYFNHSLITKRGQFHREVIFQRLPLDPEARLHGANFHCVHCSKHVRCHLALWAWLYKEMIVIFLTGPDKHDSTQEMKRKHDQKGTCVQGDKAGTFDRKEERVFYSSKQVLFYRRKYWKVLFLSKQGKLPINNLRFLNLR